MMDGGVLRHRFEVLSHAHFGLVFGSFEVPTEELVCRCVGCVFLSFVLILGVRVSTWGYFVGGRLDNFLLASRFIDERITVLLFSVHHRLRPSLSCEIFRIKKS
jgi:hypothetical protein